MKKKVAFSESGFNMFYGAQKSLYTYLTYLDKDKIEPVFLSPGKGILTSKIEELGISTKIINYPNELNQTGKEMRANNYIKKFKMGIAILKYIIILFKSLSKKDYDLVYCNDIRSILTFGLAARLKGIPVVWYVRIDKKLGIANWLAAIIANKIVTIANSVQDIFPKKFIPKSNKKFTTIYTGINLNEVDSIRIEKSIHEELKINKETKIAALIGSIQPRKGHMELIKSLIKLKEERFFETNTIKILIIGDILDDTQKDYYKELESLVLKHGLNDYVVFLGWRNDIYSIMKQINLLILPSFSEGLPRTVLEAQSCSCPVIATDVAGTGEIIINKKNGLLVTPGNIDELTNAFKYMFEDKSRLENMGKKGRVIIEEKFTINSYVDSLNKLLINLVK